MKARGGTAVMAARTSVIDALDYFPTPPWASRALVADVLPQLGVAFHTPSMTLWEPAAGGGHMVEAAAQMQRLRFGEGRHHGGELGPQAR